MKTLVYVHSVKCFLFVFDFTISSSNIPPEQTYFCALHEQQRAECTNVTESNSLLLLGDAMILCVKAPRIVRSTLFGVVFERGTSTRVQRSRPSTSTFRDACATYFAKFHLSCFQFHTFKFVPVDVEVRDDARYVFQGSWPAFEFLLPPQPGKIVQQHGSTSTRAW